MAQQSKRPCTVPGCRELISSGSGGRCSKHRKESQNSYKAMRQDKEEQAFYTSSYWRKIRAAMIRANPICVSCKTEPAAMVHHIRAREHGGNEETSNLAPLCNSCHAKIHGADNIVSVNYDRIQKD